MCGIAGIVGPIGDGQIASGQAVLNRLMHRGPDQDGVWHSSSCFLGHRRLSIIDLSEGGRQPMVDPDTGMVIVFNGECYNYRELREELEARGRQFRSTSDTEVILAAYAAWGEAATARLRGMFALAIHDPRDGSVLLVRDRLGIKPLYYAQAGGRLYFSSELRSLLAVGDIRPKLDRAGLGAYLWHGFVPGPRTLIEGIRLLDPATTLRVSAGGEIIDERRYWRLPDATVPADGVEAERQAAAELERAVELHLVSDVPLGVFLSGGTDSSVLAAMAQRSSATAVSTFNIRFDEARYDESPHARRVAGLLGTDHHEITLSESTFSDQLGPALDSIDQPTFDAINSYFVSRAVREAGLKVALAGTGGDELFGGYTSFVDLPRARPMARALGWLPGGLFELAGRGVSRMTSGPAPDLPPQTRWGKLADLMATRGDLAALYQVSYAQFTRRLLEDMKLDPDDGLHWGLYPERFAEWSRGLDGRTPLQAVSSLELGSFLGERLLRDTDAASMAVSMEVRVPLLDHRFVESLAAVPDGIRYHPVRSKQMLRNMIADQIDPAVFERPKAGFELPLDVWCRRRLAPMLRQSFECADQAERLGLRSATLRRVWHAFEQGSGGMYWSRVWSLFVLLHWCRRHDVAL